MNHLSDNEIQEILDSFQTAQSEHLQHLRSCITCAKRLELYKSVYSFLQQEESLSFPPDFSEKVLQKLERLEDKKYQMWEKVLLMCTLIEGLILAVYFIDFKKLSTGFISGPLSLVHSLFGKVLSAIPDFIPLLVFTLLILFFYGIIGRLLVPRKGVFIR